MNRVSQGRGEQRTLGAAQDKVIRPPSGRQVPNMISAGAGEPAMPHVEAVPMNPPSPDQVPGPVIRGSSPDGPPSPNARICNAYVVDCADASDRSGKTTAEDVLKVTSALIKARPSQAWACVEQLMQVGIRPNAFIFNALISASAKSGSTDEALKAFLWMQHECVKPDTYTFSALACACAKEGRADAALALSRYMTSLKVTPNAHIFSALISACVKEGRSEDALTLFRSMPSAGVKPSAHIFGIMIQACGDRTDDALGFFQQMIAAGTAPSEFVFTLLISACAKKGWIDDALRLFACMAPARVKPNVAIFSSLFSACVREGRIEDVRRLGDAMIIAGVKPNAHVFSAMLSAYGDSVQEALTFFWRMREMGVGLSAAVFNALITVCGKGGRAEIARDIYFNWMPAAGIDPDAVTINAAISAFEARECHDESRRVLADAVERGIYHAPLGWQEASNTLDFRIRQVLVLPTDDHYPNVSVPVAQALFRYHLESNRIRTDTMFCIDPRGGSTLGMALDQWRR